MSNPRFSKKTLAEFIDRRREQLETEFGFDPNNGTRQVDGKSAEVQRAYGEYDALTNLAEHFEL